MPDVTPIPARPSSETTRRFFAERRAYSIAEAASLLGWTEPHLLSDLQREGALRDDQQMSWEDVAVRFLRAWPLNWILRTVGTGPGLIADGLELVPVTWHLPRYLVLALKTQARLRPETNPEVHTDRVEDLVTDLLHPNIEPATVERLRGNAEFIEAFHFPHKAGDEE
jgi:hypothetical protein